jgi:hypothetical protein
MHSLLGLAKSDGILSENWTRRGGHGNIQRGPTASQALQRVPRVEDFVMIRPQLLRVLLEAARALRGVDARWALGGDASEVVQGVNTPAHSLEFLTFGESSTRAVHLTFGGRFPGESGAAVLQEPAELEVTLPRVAEIGEESRPVFVRSLHSKFQAGEVPIEIHGDPRIKIGDWGWGDPIEFEPALVYVVGEKLPVMPLRLRSDIYFGLGWLDRVNLIHEANRRKHHQH